MSALEPHINLWLERNGHVVLSSWRVALMEAIAETGSISAAAAHMNVPYRVAWAKIKEMERGLEVQLVQTRIGGQDGGGAHLTAVAKRYIRDYHQINTGLDEWVRHRFGEIFVTEG